MADGEITIWAPVPNGPTPGPAILKTFGDGNGYQRSRFGWQAYETHTAGGSAVIIGAYFRPKYLYSLAFTEQDNVYRQITSLMLWQQMERAAGREGRLSLRDEAWEFEPEPPPHQLALLSTLSGPGTWVYGYGTISSVLVRPAQGFSYAGWDRSSSQPYKIFQLEVVQL